jgi:uncharacterized protein YukE
MTTAQQPATLASFSENWVGGDIHGLSAFAGTMYGYLPEINGVINALDKAVGQIVHDAGWQGDAANSFSKAWEADALGATALSGVIQQVGDVCNTLAVNLSNFEHALEEAADEARKQGVKIGPDGKVQEFVGPVAPNSPEATAQSVGNEYQAYYQQCMNLAQDARVDASTALQTLYQQIQPGSPGSSDQGLSPSDKVSLADYLRGFWGLPSAQKEFFENQVGKMEKAATDAKAAWVAARDARPNPNVKMPQDVKDALKKARSDLADAKSSLEGAEETESKWIGSKVLSTSVGDVFKSLSSTADGAADSVSGLSKLVKFGEDIPVLDVVAGVAGTVLDSIDDIKNGKPWYEAVPEDALANGGGVVVGAAVGTGTTALVAGGATALGIAGAPVIGVTAGVVVGGVAAIGVCDFTKNMFNENWGQDIQKDGVVGGVADGTWHAMAKTGDDVGHLASNAWHAISSIF